MTETIERAIARNLLDIVRATQAVAPVIGAEAIACAGGVASFTGVDSPLTVIKGAGPEISQNDIETVESFFRQRGATKVSFELAPWITPASAELLASRGYAHSGEENVVIRHAPFDGPAPLQPVIPVSVEDWTSLVMEMFGVPGTPEWVAISAATAVLPDAVRLGIRTNAWISCAELIPLGEIGLFANDATLESARGQGAQTATIQERLRLAGSRNWTCVIAEVAPGSGSERNYMRCGFHIAYTRTHFTR